MSIWDILFWVVVISVVCYIKGKTKTWMFFKCLSGLVLVLLALFVIVISVVLFFIGLGWVFSLLPLPITIIIILCLLFQDKKTVVCKDDKEYELRIKNR